MVRDLIVAAATRANGHDVAGLFSRLDAVEGLAERIDCRRITEVCERRVAGQCTNAIL